MGNKFMRWFWGLMALVLLYSGTQTGLKGDSAAAAAEYVLALGCLLAVLYFAIDARITKLEASLLKRAKDTLPKDQEQEVE